ncbi:MAG: winged helix-turn-helix domain-containing protein [Lachnospiraceae bacterium]
MRLNNKEFQLMELFFRYPNKIFSPEHLMETFWVIDSNADINVIWTYISFLRKKLKEINSQVQIRTIRGAGYSLEKHKTKKQK